MTRKADDGEVSGTRSSGVPTSRTAHCAPPLAPAGDRPLGREPEEERHEEQLRRHVRHADRQRRALRLADTGDDVGRRAQRRPDGGTDEGGREVAAQVVVGAQLGATTVAATQHPGGDPHLDGDPHGVAQHQLVGAGPDQDDHRRQAAGDGGHRPLPAAAGQRDGAGAEADRPQPRGPQLGRRRQDHHRAQQDEDTEQQRGVAQHGSRHQDMIHRPDGRRQAYRRAGGPVATVGR
jgi:hypothetical protein